MSKQFLNGADIISVLEEMGGEGMPEDVRSNRFIDAGKTSSVFDRTLQIRFVQVVTPSDATDRVRRKNRSREDILPGKFTIRIRIFPFQGIWKIGGPKALGEIQPMLRLDLLEMKAKLCDEHVGEHGDAVILALAIADNNLMVVEIQILDAQPQNFHQAEPAAVQDLCHNLIDATHVGNDALCLDPGKNGGNPFWLRRTNGKQRRLVQLDVENISVEKKDGTDRLVLGRGSDGFLGNQEGNEIVDLGNTHLARVTFVVKEDVLAHPGDISLFGAKGIVAIAKSFAVLIEKLFSGLRCIGRRCQGR